jgi:putative SbcD/Mre11-related phosphoesterase
LIVEGESRVLVLSDIHLGIEYELYLGGASIPSQTGKLMSSILTLVQAVKPECILILGDIKHNVPRTSWQERDEVPKFLQRLAEVANLILVPGNHDSGLYELLPEGATIQPPSGIVFDGTGYFHGHTWPSPDVLNAAHVVMGHVHPAVRLFDPLGYSKGFSAWVRSRLNTSDLELQYGMPMPSREIVIVPAFNPLCGGLPLNDMHIDPQDGSRERGPLKSLVELPASRIYLLDGTDLGRLEMIPGARRCRRRTRQFRQKGIKEFGSDGKK